MKIGFMGYSRTETLTNFPVLVVFGNGLSGSGFSYNQMASPNGWDLLFTSSNGQSISPSFNFLGSSTFSATTQFGDQFAVSGVQQDGKASGLTVEFFPVPGKVPLYLEEAGGTPPIVLGEDTVGAMISDGKSRLFYIPGCASMTEALAQRLRGAELVLFDGTLWRDDEMIRAGLGSKTGRRMGHMSLSGPDGTIAAFSGLGVRRKVLVHINNSNPVLLDDSAERAETVAAGWEVAHDGMELQS